MKFHEARATVILATIMIGAFVIELAGSSSSQDEAATLIGLGAIVPGTLARLELWRLVAAIFLHAGIFHLLFNLWAFVQLGYGWERLFGSKRFLIAFFGSGIGASFTSALFVHAPGAVGASGAIFGLLSSFVVLLLHAPQWRSAPWARRLAWQLALWATITILLGFLNPRIDNAAHVGGTIGGVLIGTAFGKRSVRVVSVRVPKV
ncbi:MAG: rhomboid family intramembrane serine protease [Acidobacteriota bacterium]